MFKHETIHLVTNIPVHIYRPQRTRDASLARDFHQGTREISVSSACSPKAHQPRAHIYGVLQIVPGSILVRLQRRDSLVAKVVAPDPG